MAFCSDWLGSHFHIVVAAHIVMMMCLCSSPFLFLHREIAAPQSFPTPKWNRLARPELVGCILYIYSIYIWDPSLVKSLLISARELTRSLLFLHKYTSKNWKESESSPVGSYIEDMDEISWPKVFLFFFFHPLAWQWNLGASQPASHPSEEKIRLSSSSRFFSYIGPSWKSKLWKDLIKLSKQITSEENNMKPAKRGRLADWWFWPDGTNRSSASSSAGPAGQRQCRILVSTLCWCRPTAKRPAV